MVTLQVSMLCNGRASFRFIVRRPFIARSSPSNPRAGRGRRRGASPRLNRGSRVRAEAAGTARHPGAQHGSHHGACFRLRLRPRQPGGRTRRSGRRLWLSAIDIGYFAIGSLRDGLSQGSRKTMAEGLILPSPVWRHGHVVDDTTAGRVRQFAVRGKHKHAFLFSPAPKCCSYHPRCPTSTR